MCTVNKKKKKNSELMDNWLLSSFIRLVLKNDLQLNLFRGCILKGLYLIYLWNSKKSCKKMFPNSLQNIAESVTRREKWHSTLVIVQLISHSNSDQSWQRQSESWRSCHTGLTITLQYSRAHSQRSIFIHLQ